MARDRFERIVDLQRQLQRAAEWRLHELQQAERRLREAEHDALQALATDVGVDPRLAPALARRLGRLAAEADAVFAAKEGEARDVLERARLVELAQGRLQAADLARRRAVDAAALDDLANRLAGPAGARLR